MSKKQVFLIFVTFFFTLLVITLPVWIDPAMPYLNEYMHSALDYVNRLEELMGQAKDALMRVVK